jgi:hypothetical protein
MHEGPRYATSLMRISAELSFPIDAAHAPLRPKIFPFLRGSLPWDGLVLGELIAAPIPFPLAVQSFHGCDRLRAHMGHDQLVSGLEGRCWRIGVVWLIPGLVEHPPDIHHDMQRFHGLHHKDFMRSSTERRLRHDPSSGW